MALTSDITINAAKFDPASIPTKTAQLYPKLEELTQLGPQWWEVGAAKYREMRVAGKTPFPAVTYSKEARNINVPSRETGRSIPCRILEPDHGKSRGIYYHIHGGGWVLGGHDQGDPYLTYFATKANLTVVSVGYRLAPEHPFPAGPDDCLDVAKWLVDNSREQFGVDMLFMGGQSAGAHLTAVTHFALLDARPKFTFKALHFDYGIFDLSSTTPSVHTFPKQCVLTRDMITHYIAAFCPNLSPAGRADPTISPIFTDLRCSAERHGHARALPPALFACGTGDPLLDDTLFMYARWVAAGASAVIKIYPGAPHGFSTFAEGSIEAADEGKEDALSFLEDHLD